LNANHEEKRQVVPGGGFIVSQPKEKAKE
jgi:hypothetical protein